ncbi:MAG: YadA-like family protein, partial [Alcaligenaceae bacterium]|nr:YadA-like family protein [Alcaligenaceae bacterium]
LKQNNGEADLTVDLSSLKTDANVISNAKTKVDVKGNYLTIDKTESTDTTANEYTVGLDLKKVKEDLATGSIVGTGITVEGGNKSTFKDVKLSIADHAITTDKIKDKNVTKAKLADNVTSILDLVQPNQQNIATNTTAIAINKAEIAKKVNAADMNGTLSSQSITVTGEGKDKLLKDIHIEVNKTLTGMDSISFGHGVSISSNGLNNGGQRITNVAAGVNPDDAVNVAQLNEVKQAVNQVNKRASRGTAVAGAVANLPQEFRPGRIAVAMSGAYYDGVGAMAVGVSSISDNGRWLIKGSASTGFKKNNTMIGGGVQYSW